MVPPGQWSTFPRDISCTHLVSMLVRETRTSLPGTPSNWLLTVHRVVWRTCRPGMTNMSSVMASPTHRKTSPQDSYGMSSSSSLSHVQKTYRDRNQGTKQRRWLPTPSSTCLIRKIGMYYGSLRPHAPNMCRADNMSKWHWMWRYHLPSTCLEGKRSNMCPRPRQPRRSTCRRRKTRK